MKDLEIKNTGNSRYLKSNYNGTWDEAKALLQAGLFPVDFVGLNEEGINQRGTPLNKETLLSDETAALMGLGDSATPDDALQTCFNQLGSETVGSSMQMIYLREGVPTAGLRFTWNGATETLEITG